MHTVTKGKGQLPRTSRWQLCRLSFSDVITLPHYTQCSLSLSRSSKSNKKTPNTTGAAIQANTHDVNQPGPVVALNDYNEYKTNLNMVTTSLHFSCAIGYDLLCPSKDKGENLESLFFVKWHNLQSVKYMPTSRDVVCFKL
jgi:hypothetical protein